MQTVKGNMQDPLDLKPKTLLAAKEVKLAMIEYVGPRSEKIIQLAVVGDKRVFLLDSRELGFNRDTVPTGDAAQWLAEAVISKLNESK